MLPQIGITDINPSNHFAKGDESATLIPCIESPYVTAEKKRVFQYEKLR